MAAALGAAESVEILPAAVRELHVADRNGGRARRFSLGERLEPQHALDRPHEPHEHPAVDPGQGDRGELELVREDGAVPLEEVGDQVDAGRRVGDEGDLLGLGPDEAGHLPPRRLAPLQPGVPVAVAPLLELAVERGDGLAHRPGREGRGRGVEVDLPGQAREVAADVVPERGHGGQG